jgi:general secretion pathway protein A
MFLDFYGLCEQPFGVTPDPAYLYLSRTHREALAALLYGIKSDRGFMALIAEPGMGKTTLLYRLLENLGESARAVYLFQTQCDPREFFCYLLGELAIETSGMDLASMHKKLNDVLFSEMLAGRRFVLVVDEAQNLSGEVLETIRLLSDFETAHSKLLEIVLAGQPQLAEKLAQPRLSQLRQRITFLCHLEPLRSDEIAGYVDHRLKVAGYSGDGLFERNALERIAKESQGVPRDINNICFTSLLLGKARGQRRISEEIAGEAARGYRTISEEIARELTSNGILPSRSPLSGTEGRLAPVAPSETSPKESSSRDSYLELIEKIQQKITRRAYELFESSGFSPGHALDHWLQAESEILVPVPVDVAETETELTLRADVPGFGEKDLELRVAPRSLCISGKRHESSGQKEGKTLFSERRAKQIFRLLDLPSQIDPDRVKATVSDGVLEIKMCKVGAGKKVPILAKTATA